MSSPTSIQIPASSAESAAPGSLPSRIAQVFFSPGQLFESFRERAPWGGTLLAVAVGVLGIMVALFFLVSDQVFVDTFRQALVEQGQQLPPEEQLLQMAKFQKMAIIIANPIITALSAFLYAFVMWLMFSVVGGGKARYGQYMAIATHVMFIALLGAVITVPLMALAGNLEIKLGPTLFLDGMKKTSFAYMALDKLDVFNLWSMAVAGIGVATVNRKGSWALSAAILTAVYVLLTAGTGAVFAAMASGGQAS